MNLAAAVLIPTAIRDFVKMYYDKLGTILPINQNIFYYLEMLHLIIKTGLTNNTNFVPAYENNFSLDPLSTYTSDDFFGFLDDNEDINSGAIINYLDIGIGRVPAKNIEEAKNFVDKVEAYFSSAKFWALEK